VQVVVNEEVDPSLVIKRLKQEIRDLKDEIRSWLNLSIFYIYMMMSYTSNCLLDQTNMQYILQVVYLEHLSIYADKFLHTSSLWSCSMLSCVMRTADAVAQSS
jgi:hypothetical protein